MDHVKMGARLLFWLKVNVLTQTSTARLCTGLVSNLSFPCNSPSPFSQAARNHNMEGVEKLALAGHSKRISQKESLTSPSTRSRSLPSKQSSSYVDTFGRSLANASLLQFSHHSRGYLPDFLPAPIEDSIFQEIVVKDNSVDSLIGSESNEADENEVQPRLLFSQSSQPASGLPPSTYGADWNRRSDAFGGDGSNTRQLESKKRVPMCMPIPVISGVGLNTAAAGSSYRYGLAAFGTSPDLTSSTSQHDVKGKSKSVEGTFDDEERPNIPPTSCDDYAVRSSAVDFGISDMQVPTVKDAQHTPHSANKPSQSSTCRIENLRNPVTTGLKDEPKRIHFGASLSSFIDDDKKLNAKEVTRTGLEQFDPFLQLKSRFGDVVGAPVAEMFPPETPIRDLGLITPSPTHRETINRTHSLPEKLSDCIRDNGRKRRDSHVRFMEGDEPFGPHRLNRDSRRLASYSYPRPSPYPYQSVVSSGMSHQPINQLPPHAAVLTSRALHQSNSSHSLPPEYSFMRGPFSFAERPSDGRPGSNFDEFTLVAPGKNEAFNQGGTSELDASADYFVIALSRSDSAVYQFKDVLGQLLIRWINWFVLEERDRFYYKREDEERGWIRTMITALMIVVVIQVLVCFSLIQHGLELGGKLLGVDVRSAFRGRSRWGQNPRA